MKVSGYLSIYNDWDILATALRSVLPYLDELIVVDGAYEWMANLLTRIGRSPERSSSEVYDILGSLEVKTTIVTGIWKNEIEKRLAGYSACTGDYVLRIDSDEILYFEDGAIERFLSSAFAVAEMEMPIYVCPGWIKTRGKIEHLPRQSFIFKRSQITPEEHLHYLWLVLMADELPPIVRRLPVFPEPVAFNAHLTTWRTPNTAIQRAFFYSLNWSRKFGVTWISELRNKPLQDVAELLKYIRADMYLETMLGHNLVSGNIDMDGQVLRPTPLTADQELVLLPLRKRYIESHVEQNILIKKRPRHLLGGEPVYFNVTEAPCLEALSEFGKIKFEASSIIRFAKVQIHYLIPCEPWTVSFELEAEIEGIYLTIEMPTSRAPRCFLQRTLEITFWFGPHTLLENIVCL